MVKFVNPETTVLLPISNNELVNIRTLLGCTSDRLRLQKLSLFIVVNVGKCYHIIEYKVY